ncbi:MAG: GtrA family protein [Nitrospirota bacterium]
MGRELKQLFKFGFVGGFCALLDMSFMYALVEYIHLSILLSATVAFLSVGMIGYLLQKYITFQSRGAISAGELFSFFSILTIGLVLNSLIIVVSVEILGWWYLWGSALAKGGVAITNYLGHKYITFR